jgi:23S rRNA (uracil1939-C5)-methyltransferase
LLLTIEKLIYGGDGLAHLPAGEHGPGKAVFVPFVLEGEQIEASVVEEKRGFVRARSDKILQASARRIEPQCPYFQRCGGCHYQHARYEHQLEIKAGILKENLRRIAKLELEKELIVHPSPEWNYRNRTRLKVQTAPEFALGYYQFGSHDLLPTEECPISSPLINQAMAALWRLGREGGVVEGLQEIEFFANAEDKQLLVAGYGASSMGRSAAMECAVKMQRVLPQMAGMVVFSGRDQAGYEPKRIAAVGTPELNYKTREACYRVSAGAFFQTNRHLIDQLLEIVTSGQSGHLALDLYAGVGLFSSVLSRRFAQVIAVEPSPTSHHDLGYNSPANVKAIRAATERYLQDAVGKVQPDLVVVDPPRGGLGEHVVRGLVQLGAPRCIYVSCDPATLARDLGSLLRAGYRVEQAHLVDLFPQTYHLESVFHLVQ